NILRYQIDIDTKSYFRHPSILMGGRKFIRRPFPFKAITSLSCNLDYSYKSEEEKIVLDKISCIDNTNFLIESRKNISGTFRFAYGNAGSDKRLKWSNPNLKSLTDYLAPRASKEYLLEKNLSPFRSERLFHLKRSFLGYLDILINELEMMNYLGPFRQTPDRYYMTGG